MDYFAEVQKRYIEKALNLKEVSSTSFEEIANILTGKVENWQKTKEEEREAILNRARIKVFNYCLNYLTETQHNLERRLNGSTRLSVQFCSPEQQEEQHYYQSQIIKYAQKHNYYFNRSLPKSRLTFRIELSDTKKYQLVVTIHHYGYDDNTLALGAFLEFFQSNEKEEGIDAPLPLEIKPHIISISADIKSKEKNIRAFLENAVTLTLAQIAREL